MAKDDGKEKDKDITIILNGTETVVTVKEMTIAELAKLAGLPSGPTIFYSGSFSKGDGGKEGTLSQTDPIKLKKGMIIDVTATDRS